MGIMRNIFGGSREAVEDTRAIAGFIEEFAVDAGSVDPSVFGIATYASNTPSRAARVDRATAMQVGAVKRCRDLIAGAAGALPLRLRDGAGAFGPWSLFDQPERNVPRSVTMTRLFEDMLFEGIGWWEVKEIGWHTYPSFVRRAAPGSVVVNEESGRVYLYGREVPPSQVIGFPSPNDALLVAGARAIRVCLLLDAAAANMADGVPPADYFTPGEGMDPATTDAEIVDMLDTWQERRRARSTGYVPAALDYHQSGWSPKDLQLGEARQHAVLEIARVAGVDPEELGVSTTSRTYSSDWSRRKAFLDFTLGGYLNASTDRLRMPDVTPRGYEPDLDLDAFLRTDTLTRYNTYRAGLDVGALTPPEVREAEGKAPIDQQPTALPAAPLRALPSTTEEAAS